MTDSSNTLLIKRYASRRLYNTETSDYVTLEDIAEVIRDGREVQIIDLKSGDDLTRQYLLQIIAEHESRGENVLPVNVLTDLVRSYTTHAKSFVPDFLSASFDMFRESQSNWVEQMTKANPLANMPGMDAVRAQQEAFFKAWTGGNLNPAADTAEQGNNANPGAGKSDGSEDLTEIKKQLNDLQKKLSRLS